MSFLHDYLVYASDNEAPEMFHVWGAYAALSSAVSRKVWLPFGKRALFPNIYVMLVGDAGNGKSIAMYYSKLLQANVGSIPISGNIETPPGLWRFMGGNLKADPPVDSPVKFLARWPDGQMRDVHPMTIIANEFIDFISIDETGWINALNNIYDEDVYRYRTKNQGEDILIGPYIVLFGGLTTDVAHDLQRTRIISTGLARRTIFQYGERKWHEPHALLEESAEQQAAFLRCVAHLKKLNAKSVCGAFNWLDETKLWWVDWYNAHSIKVPDMPPQTRSWFASKPDQILKLAMLTALSEGLDLVLKKEHLVCALEYLAVLEQDLFKIFGGIGENKLASVAQKILEYIDGISEPISRNSLYVRFFNMYPSQDTQRDFDEIMRYLVATKTVMEYSANVANRPIESIYATPRVMKKWLLASGATNSPLLDAIQSVLPPDEPVGVDPLPVQASSLFPVTPLDLSSVRLGDEIEDGALPKSVQSLIENAIATATAPTPPETSPPAVSPVET